MEGLGTSAHRRELTSLEAHPGTHSAVVRPKPTLPCGDAAPLASHTSAFQRLAAEGAAAVAVPESLQAPPPRSCAGGATAPAACSEQLQTTSEDELAATTVGSLQHNRGAGPSQLNRQRSRDSNDGVDELSRPTPAPALHASQQAMLQQQVLGPLYAPTPSASWSGISSRCPVDQMACGSKSPASLRRNFCRHGASCVNANECSFSAASPRPSAVICPNLLPPMVQNAAGCTA